MQVLRRVLRLVGLKGGSGVLKKGLMAMGFGSLAVGMRLGWLGLIVGEVEE